MKMNILSALVILLAATLAFSCQEQPADVQDPPLTAVDVPVPYGPDAITRNFIEDKDGNIWAASFGGVFRYDGESFTNVTELISKGRFFDVLQDKNGAFWFTSIGEGAYHYGDKGFQNFTMRNGLLSNRVTEVYEDRSGTIWFGSEGGVNRYDGKAFQDFTVKDGLPDNDVGTIIEDQSGTMWFGSRAGVATFDGDSFDIFYLKSSSGGQKENRPFSNTRCIIEDKKGNIWIGGRDGLWRYNGSELKQYTTHFVGHIYEDRAGNIWTSSESNNASNWLLSRYDASALDAEIIAPTVVATDKFMVFGILEDRNGNIWFGSNAANHFDGQKVTRFQRDLEWQSEDWRID